VATLLPFKSAPPPFILRRMAKPALGRGLGALLGGATPAPALPPATTATATTVISPADSHERVRRVALDRIQPCPFQPRKEFTQAALQELADSIKEQGIIQPLVARPRGDTYELIAGERRLRAAQLLGLKEVPIIVREADDRAMLELALIENLQRENLNPLEEAHGYAELIEKFQLRQEDVALKVGRSRVAVANSLRLLKLAPEAQACLRDGRLSVGHAKVILGLPGHAEQKLASERVIAHGLNVRQTEELVARLLHHPVTPGSPRDVGHAVLAHRDPHVSSIENKLCERFGTKAQLRYRQGKGTIELRFYTDDDLERILQLAGVSVE
jgi:ParB family transcriptional regulator, chromosome partitioning protein